MKIETKIKIVIADDHPVFRRGLRSVIESDPRFDVVGEAENGEVAIRLCEQLHPHVVILDVDMPLMDGIAAAGYLNKNSFSGEAVFLTLHKDKEILNAMKLLNVKGYLLKDGAILEVISCIEQVAAGNIFISPKITDLLLQHADDRSWEHYHNNALAKLTPTETRILRLISDSKTNREIAEELFISIRTAENHRFNICSKLDIRGNHSLLKFALANRKMIHSIASNE